MSVETVYKTFGNKPGLVKAVFDVSIVGDDEPVPLLQRERVQHIGAEPDPRRKLEMYGEHLIETARVPSRSSSWSGRRRPATRGPPRYGSRCRPSGSTA